MNESAAVLGFMLVLTLGTAPAATEDGPYYPDEELCQAIFRFAGSDPRHSRRVRLQQVRGNPSMLKCAAGNGPAGREMCAVLEARVAQLAVPVFAQNALSCIGVGEPPSDDPDALVTHSFWTKGTFNSDPPHFAEGKVRIEVSFDGREKTSRHWITIAAIPIR